MMGMIKKDILMIRNNIKVILVAILICILGSLTNDMTLLFIIPFMTVMISISTFSYDDFNNWHAYAVTLPSGRKSVVKGKYIATVLLTIVATIMCVLLSIIMSGFRGPLDLDETISSIVGSLFALIILISILFPIIFKYGSEKGRIILFIGCFALFGILAILAEVIKVDIPVSIISFLDSYALIIIPIISIVILFISYKISQRIYLKKEF